MMHKEYWGEITRSASRASFLRAIFDGEVKTEGPVTSSGPSELVGEGSMELWEPIPDFEGYEVSNEGRVRSWWKLGQRGRGGFMDNPRILSATINAQGYRQVTLRTTKKTVHRIVLETFVGPCPPGMEALHNNGIRHDSRLENLRWGTRSENVLDCVAHGNNVNANKTHCPKGHEYSEANTYVYRNRRTCRTCDNARKKKRTN